MSHSTRREAMKQAASALGGLAVSSLASQLPAAKTAVGAIDAHSHVWTSDVERYPLASGYNAEQVQPASFTPEQLLSHANPCRVSRVVLIQMSYYRYDNSYMLDSIRQHPGVFSGVAVVDEHAGNLSDTMSDLKRQGVRGFRIHPGMQDVEAWMNSDGMAAMWRIGAEQQLAMCALVNPPALGPLDKMCQRFPDTTLVIDHFARIGVDGTIRGEELDALCRLARHRNTAVKVSAFYALGKKKAPYTDLGPMIRRLRDAFGSQRLMWATDCPYQVENGHNYRDSIELIRSRLDFLTDDDRDWLLGKTAHRIFFS